MYTLRELRLLLLLLLVLPAAWVSSQKLWSPLIVLLEEEEGF